MNILFEDNHLIAINKPAGMLTHSDITGDKTALELTKSYIKKKYNKPGEVFLQPVHRLDRPTSGLLLFARTSKATVRMTKIFKERDCQKIYYALSDHLPQQFSGNLEHFLEKNHKKNIVNASKKNVDNSKKAVLNYEVISSFNNLNLFKILPKTGRSHQIRVQLAEIGCPIIGDLKYGSKIKTDGRSIGLHAFSLSLIHPVRKNQLMIQCPFPDNEFWKSFQQFQPKVK